MKSKLILWSKLLLAVVIIGILGLVSGTVFAHKPTPNTQANTRPVSLSLAQASPGVAAPTFTSSDNGEFIWARAFGGEYWDGGGKGVYVDTSGNVYTTGEFTNVADFDPGAGVFNLTCAGYVDIFISKLDNGGNFVWAKRLGGSDHESSNNVYVDGEGNVYTTGFFYGTVDFDPGAGIFNMTSAGFGDIFISKLDREGNFVWAKALGGISVDVSKDIFVDGAGNVYTTGWFDDTADFDPGPGTFNLTSAGSYDVFVSKLDEAGNFVWAKAMGGAFSDWGQSLFGDGAGNIYTTGEFMDVADFDPGPGTFNLTGTDHPDIFVSKLDSAGDYVWAKALGGTDYEESNDIFVDRLGNVYTTGSFRGIGDFDPSVGTFNLTSAGDYDVFVSKLDEAGDFVWARGFGGTGWEDSIGISVDAAWNVHTTGRFEGTADFDPGTGVFNLTSAGEDDIFISKLGEAGNFLWAKRFGGTGQDSGNDIFIDGAGNVYTTGGFFGTVDFDPGPGTFDLTSAGLEDIFVYKLRSTYLVNAPLIIYNASPQPSK